MPHTVSNNPVTTALHSLVISLILCPVGSAQVEQGYAIGLVPASGGSKDRFVVKGLDTDRLDAIARLVAEDPRQPLLEVHVVSDETSGDIPPLAGRHRVADHQLIFEPQFPLLPGVRYQAALPPPVAARFDLTPIEGVFSIPKPETRPSTLITAVYPSGDVMPENLLRFYVHFSAAMRQGDIYRHIHLIDSEGIEVRYPFLEIDEELWDRDVTRLTLLFDPGRIKRGLRPREELGPALEEGRSYTLLIDRAWLDARGEPLVESFRKSFRVVAPDDVQPDPQAWRLEVPAAGSRNPLAVRFAEPLDHGMLKRVVWIVDPQGRPVEGHVGVSGNQTLWDFTPDVAWRRGSYKLVADTALEDRAGNSIARPFEVDVFERVEHGPKRETADIPFEITAAAAAQ